MKVRVWAGWLTSAGSGLASSSIGRHRALAWWPRHPRLCLLRVDAVITSGHLHVQGTLPSQNRMYRVPLPCEATYPC